MKSIDECYMEIDDIIGYFCSTCFSFALARKEFNNLLQSHGTPPKGCQTMEQLDAVPFSFKGDECIYHKTTVGEYKKRIQKDGIDTKILANNAFVVIYHIGEDKYRKIIAHECGLEKDEIKHYVFGELRHIRCSIVHNKSLATKECEKNILLKKFCEGELIFFNEQEAYDSFMTIKDALKELNSTLRS
jgi:hypothetical protein